MEKKNAKKNKIARGFFGLYFGLFAGVCALAAAFAWFGGTIERKGIQVTTGEIKIDANAYSYDSTNGLVKLGDGATDENPLVFNLDNGPKTLYIIVDKKADSIDADYFLNLTVENIKDVGYSNFQRDELTRYLSGFKYSFAKLTTNVNDPDVVQRATYPRTYDNNYEERLDSYIRNCNEHTPQPITIYPDSADEYKSLASLSDTQERDCLDGDLAANYYVFHYEYDNGLEELTARNIQIALNVSYAQKGTLTAGEIDPSYLYATTQALFNTYVRTYRPGQTIKVTKDVTYSGDLVFEAPVHLLFDNAKLTLSGNLIFNYPYYEKSTINTVRAGQVIVKAISSSGGNFEVDVPNGEFEFIGKGASTLLPDMYVQNDVTFRGSYDNGITLSGANIYTLTSTGEIPTTKTVKDISFKDNACITIAANTKVGTIVPYVSSTAGAGAPKTVAIIIYGEVRGINITSMNVITHNGYTYYKQQIVIDSYGTFIEPIIALPAWSQPWSEISDTIHGRYTIGNTTIRQYFASTPLDIYAAPSSTNPDQFEREDIICELRDHYVVENDNEGKNITIFHQEHERANIGGTISSIDDIMKEFYYPNGYTDTYAAAYNNKINAIETCEIISGNDTRLTSADQTFINSWNHLKSLDLTKAKYVDDYIQQTYFENSQLERLCLPDTTTTIDSKFIVNASNLSEIDIPSTVTTVGKAVFYTNGFSQSRPRIFHIKNNVSAYSIHKVTCINYNVILCVPSELLSSYRSIGSSSELSFRHKIVLDGIVSEDRNYIYNDLGNGKYQIEKCLLPSNRNNASGSTVIDQFEVDSATVGTIQRINDFAYYNFTNWGNLSFGNDVEYIGQNAFSSGSMSSVTINKNIEFGSSSFNQCTITGAVTLSNINIIGAYCFWGATIGGNVTITDCPTIDQYCFQNAKITGNLTITGTNACNQYSFQGITLGGNLTITNCTYFGAAAFRTSTLKKNVTITSSNQMNMKRYAFSYCNITGDLTVSNFKNEHEAFASGNCQNAYVSNATLTGYSGFRSFVCRGNFNLSDSNVTGDVAFAGSIFKNVTISNTSISATPTNGSGGNGKSFGDNTEITGTLTIKDNCNISHSSKPCFQTATINNLVFSSQTTVGSYCFYDCKITNLDLSGVTTLSTYAFGYAKVTNLTNCSDLISIGASALCGFSCDNTRVFDAPNVTTIGQAAFQSSYFEVIKIPKCVTIGGNIPFKGCPNLTVIYLGPIITKNDTGATFGETTCLKYVFICHDNVTDFGTNSINWTQCLGGLNANIIVSSMYYDSISYNGSKKCYIHRYNGAINDTNLIVYGTADLPENAVYNYGDGIFYYNSDVDDAGLPCATLFIINAESIVDTNYTTPAFVNNGTRNVKVTGINSAYNSVIISVSGTFTINSNTTLFQDFTCSSNTQFTIGTFSAPHLTKLTGGCFRGGTYGTINLNGVTEISNYCFTGWGISEKTNIGTLNLDGLVTSNASYIFGYISLSNNLNITNLTTITNGCWFYGGEFGTINANSLTTANNLFDWSGAPADSSSFANINMKNLTIMPDTAFYNTAEIQEMHFDKVTTGYWIFKQVSRGPEVVELPSLATVNGPSTHTSLYFGYGTEKIYLPELTSLLSNGYFGIGMELKELILPKITTLKAFTGNTARNLKVLYCPQLKPTSYVSFQVGVCSNGVRDVYIYNLFQAGGTANPLYYLFQNNVDNICFSGTSYDITLKQLWTRNSRGTPINVYVRGSIYNGLTAAQISSFSGRGFNIISTGDHDPAEIYFNGIGSVTLSGSDHVYPEYQYLEDDDGITLIKCNKDKYEATNFEVGGTATLSKIVDGSTVTYTKPIKELGGFLYNSTIIDADTITISSTVVDIKQSAFGTGKAKTCNTLVLKNTGVVSTNAFAGLTIGENLLIHNCSAIQTNALPTVNNLAIKIFNTSNFITSTGAFGTAANTSTLYAPSRFIGQYRSTSGWNNIPSSNISSYDSSFQVVEGEDPNQVTYTYYYRLLSDGIDIVYASSSVHVNDIVIPTTATIEVAGANVTKNVVMIESPALLGLGAITSVTFPSTLKNYAYDSDFEPGTLTSYIVASGNTYFEADAGVLYNYGKTKLISYPKGKTGGSFTVPSTVTTISSGAFADCDRLLNLTIAPASGSTVTIQDRAFEDCDILTTLTITGNSILSDYALADSELATVNLNGNVTIGSYAFENCSRLVEINISGKAIFESCAFADSNENITINFTGSVASEFIGKNIFKGIASYSLVVPNGTIGSYFENVSYDIGILSHFSEAAAPHTCSHVCDVCGGCTDEDCEETACATKCTCESGGDA